MRRANNLEPYIELFHELYPSYIQNGYLEPRPETYEAFITNAALYTLTLIEGDIESSSESETGSKVQAVLSGGMSERAYKRILVEAQRIRGFCEYLNAGKGVKAAARQPGTFALHVVDCGQHHDMLYTILLKQKRRWWWPWTISERAEVIKY